MQGIGPARQAAAPVLEAAYCLDLRFVSVALLWLRGIASRGVRSTRT